MKWLPLYVLVTATPLAGQEAVPSFTTGDWVRLSTRQFDAEPDWRVGALAAVTDRYIVIAPIGQEPLAVPHRTVTRFQLQTGWKTAWKQGALWGGLGGLAVSLLAVAVTDCNAVCLVGAPLSASVGGMLGARRNSMHWVPIPPSRVRPHNIAFDAVSVPLHRFVF